LKIQRLTPNILNRLYWLVRLLTLAIGVAIVFCFAVIMIEFLRDYKYWIVLLSLLAFPITSMISWRWPSIGGILATVISSVAIYISLSFITSPYRIALYSFYNSNAWDTYTRILLICSISYLILGLLYIVVGGWKRKKSLSTP